MNFKIFKLVFSKRQRLSGEELQGDEDLAITGLRSDDDGSDDNSTRCDSNDFVGGVVFSNAWMYDGDQWSNLPPMSTTRDRPSCSLAPSEDGTVSSLLLGMLLKIGQFFW